MLTNATKVQEQFLTASQLTHDLLSHFLYRLCDKERRFGTFAQKSYVTAGSDKHADCSSQGCDFSKVRFSSKFSSVQRLSSFEVRQNHSCLWWSTKPSGFYPLGTCVKAERWTGMTSWMNGSHTKSQRKEAAKPQWTNLIQRTQRSPCKLCSVLPYIANKILHHNDHKQHCLPVTSKLVWWHWLVESV